MAHTRQSRPDSGPAERSCSRCRPFSQGPSVLNPTQVTSDGRKSRPAARLRLVRACLQSSTGHVLYGYRIRITLKVAEEPGRASRGGAVRAAGPFRGAPAYSQVDILGLRYKSESCGGTWKRIAGRSCSRCLSFSWCGKVRVVNVRLLMFYCGRHALRHVTRSEGEDCGLRVAEAPGRASRGGALRAAGPSRRAPAYSQVDVLVLR